MSKQINCPCYKEDSDFYPDGTCYPQWDYCNFEKEDYNNCKVYINHKLIIDKLRKRFTND